MKRFIKAIYELAASLRELARAITAASLKIEGVAYSIKPETITPKAKPKVEPKPIEKASPKKNDIPRKHNTPWSKEDIETLKTLLKAGVSYAEIGRILERYPKNCNQYVIDHKNIFNS